MAATDFKDYYAVLGISKSADADEIKRVYRKLARKYHPDMNPGDRQAETRFKEVSEAYEVLSDPEKRRKYDQFGQYWRQADQAGRAGSPFNPNGFGDFDGFEFGRYGSFDDFINELLGRMGADMGQDRSAQGRQRGATGYSTSSGNNLDTEASLSLTFAEAFRGTEKRLSVGGDTFTVRIPPGTKPGQKIRVRGKGQFSPMYTTERGDLYLKTEVAPHPFFQLDGDALVCEVPIAPDEAVLGAEIEVPTPDGSVTVKIPAGIRSGQSLRLRGKGWVTKAGRGDQLVKVIIVPPKDLSGEERDLYEKIKTSRKTDPRSQLKDVQL